jgi:hypothetical protein
VRAYVEGGVQTPVIALVPAPGADLPAAVSALGPNSEVDTWN